MTLLAAWQTLLARYTGRDDIAVGTPVANRGRAEIERLIGFFVNTLVLRTRPRRRPELPRSARARPHGVRRRLRAPGSAIREARRGAAAASATSRGPPLFQVMFALQDTSTSELTLADLDTSYLPLHNNTAKFQLNVNLRR